MSSHNKVVQVVSAMPFERKNWVRGAFLEGRDAARAGNTVVQRRSVRALAKLALMHVPITAVSATIAAVHTYNAIKYGSVMDAVQGVYDAAYSATNGAVVYTQAVLASRLYREAPVEAAEDLAGAGGVRAYDRVSDPKDMAVTAAAQLGFIATVVTL